MAYTPVSLPPAAGPYVREVVEGSIDLRLSDVHTMLQLPRGDLKAGCNFTIAMALFSVIEGVSAVLHPLYGSSSGAFNECITKHYVTSGEPPGALSPEEIVDELYPKFRSGMQHCLGIAIRQPDTQGIRERADWAGTVLTIFRDRPPLSEEELQWLETRQDWPSFLSRPTMQRENGGLILSVEALYFGTRRLIAKILADGAIVASAERYLRDKFGSAPPRKDDGFIALSNATATAMVTSGSSMGYFDDLNGRGPRE